MDFRIYIILDIVVCVCIFKINIGWNRKRDRIFEGNGFVSLEYIVVNSKRLLM